MGSMLPYIAYMDPMGIHHRMGAGSEALWLVLVGLCILGSALRGEKGRKGAQRRDLVTRGSYPLAIKHGNGRSTICL